MSDRKKRRSNGDRVHAGLARARDLCATSRLQFTPLRQAVLEVLLQHQTHLGAYRILQLLIERGVTVTPVTVYRTLDALVEAGAVRRLPSKRAYLAAQAIRDWGDDAAVRPLYFICERCGQARETEGEAAFEVLTLVARKAGLPLALTSVEANGLCAGCAGRNARD
jgi:Fur family transcriptional regulator, zinc uptake regulator